MLVYHANESVTYTSTVYGATETVDHRYAGSTTVDVGNTAKRALWGTFGDFQTFTSDVGQNGQRTNADPYARETVGLYLKPDTSDQAVIQRKQNLLRNALREFLPARCRRCSGRNRREGTLQHSEGENIWATFREIPLIRERVCGRSSPTRRASARRRLE